MKNICRNIIIPGLILIRYETWFPSKANGLLCAVTPLDYSLFHTEFADHFQSYWASRFETQSSWSWTSFVIFPRDLILSSRRDRLKSGEQGRIEGEPGGAGGWNWEPSYHRGGMAELFQSLVWNSLFTTGLSEKCDREGGEMADTISDILVCVQRCQNLIRNR